MKRRKKTELEKLNHELDKTWSIAVKVKAGRKCEYCGTQDNLNSHHVYGRVKRSVRWDLDNGVCLCVGHHTYNHGFSAHTTPNDFTHWFEKYKGQEFADKLKLKAHRTKKWTMEEKKELLGYLKEIIKGYE